MRRARMMIVQVNGELLPQGGIRAHRILEKALLDVTRQIRPDAQRGLSNNMCKAAPVGAHSRSFLRRLGPTVGDENKNR